MSRLECLNCDAPLAESSECLACLEPDRYDVHTCDELCDTCRDQVCGYCKGLHDYDEAACRMEFEIRRSNTPGGLLGDPEPYGPGYHAGHFNPWTD